jgi:hypothetical protein
LTGPIFASHPPRPHEIGDFDVCRNLARIASSICDSWVDTINHSNTVQSCSPEGGALAVLLKGANHPSVNICAICLRPLTRLMPLVSSLPLELLPILQRRAIIPHHLRGGKIDLDALDLCGVAINDFHSFRLTVLSDALLACWAKNDEHYMDSCTAAIEEFCGTTSSIDVSLQTEAAFFCIEQMFWDVTDESRETYPANKVMGRLVKALLIKPPIVMSNALTRETMCRLVRKVSDEHIFAASRRLLHSKVLTLVDFNVCSMWDGLQPIVSWMLRWSLYWHLFMRLLYPQQISVRLLKSMKMRLILVSMKHH